MPTRIPSLLEQATKSNLGGTNPQVRQQLEVYSSTEVDAAISGATAGIDLSAYALQSTVDAISGNLSTDIYNLDSSLTQKIQEDCLQSDAISGASTTLNGHIIITINGTTYKLATVA